MVRYKNFQKDKERVLLVLSHLRKDARIPLTSLSRKTGIPVSTLFDMLKSLQKQGFVKNLTALVNFAKFGYQARAFVAFSAEKQNRERLLEALSRNSCVNCLFRVNNGWHFLAEVILPNIGEIEGFIEEIEEKVQIENKKIFYVIDEVKREAFIGNINNP
jgi:Lrp/AsnC family transcriptional regulator for asnA, asnC and gidA